MQGPIVLILACLFSLGAGNLTRAEETPVPAVYVGEDEEYGYTYECPGIGSFSTNIGPETEETVAIIVAEDRTRGELYRDGRRQEYNRDTILFESGDYEFRLYPSGEQTDRYGSFSFTLKQQELSLRTEEIFQIEENPPMEVRYDPDADRYGYTLPSGASFYMSVPNGATAAGPVVISLPDTVTIYGISRNGEIETDLDGTLYREPGTYQVLCMGGQAGEKEAERSGFYRFTLSFIIIPYCESGRDLVNPPVGFRISRVLQDGMQIPSKEAYLELHQDGMYRILFEKADQRELVYELEFVADRTAPALKFSRSIYEPVVAAPLSYQVTEADSTVEAYRNGEKLLLTGEPLTEGGTYRITVTDRAGNRQNYEFRLGYYVDIRDKSMIILSAIAVIGGLCWLLYQRGHMEIL
ncbi:MAG: hypothetical protein Q4F28_14595 [Eubacteriales bacterium]|nr:hypothetical protein [Eubacteriales bacterium]